MGDDYTDVVVMHRVGLAVATANAKPEVKAEAHWVTPNVGGRGAVRDVVELLLRAQGRWDGHLAALRDRAAREVADGNRHQSAAQACFNPRRASRPGRPSTTSTAFAATFAAVKPYFSSTILNGADAPKRFSMPSTSPDRRTCPSPSGRRPRWPRAATRSAAAPASR